MPFADSTALRRFDPHKFKKLGIFETEDMFCDVYCLEPGQEQTPHTHEHATKVYLVLEGSGSFLAGDEERTLRPGGVAWASPGAVHGIRALDERLVVLAAMAPNPNRRT